MAVDDVFTDDEQVVTWADTDRANGIPILGPNNKIQLKNLELIKEIDTKIALGRVRAGIATRATKPVAFVALGGSTTAGNNASSEANRFLNKLSAFMQNAYGLPNAAASPAVKTLAAATAPLPIGIQWLNNGRTNALVSNYLTSAEITKIASLSGPSALTVVQHMIGAADWTAGTPLNTFEQALAGRLLDIENQVGAAGQVVQVIVATYGMSNTVSTTKIAAWEEYVAIMKKLAEVNPAGRVFIDLATPFYEAGISNLPYNNMYDPFDFIDTDNRALNDKGHDLMADLLRSAYNIPLIGVGSTSPTTPTQPDPVLTNSVAPAITGTARTGNTLTVTNGTWSGTGTTFTRQWRRNGLAISGETGTTYMLVADDVNQSISVVVTASASGYTSNTATSNTVRPELGVLSNTTRPSIAGTPQVGQQVSAVPGTWTKTGTSYFYFWLRNGVPIGSTGEASVYTITADDANQQLSVNVFATLPGYSNADATSDAVSVTTVTAPVSGTLLTSDNFDGAAGLIRSTNTDANLGGTPVNYNTYPGTSFSRNGSGLLVAGTSPASTAVLPIDTGSINHRVIVKIKRLMTAGISIDLRRSGISASDPCIRINCSVTLGQLLIQTRGTGSTTYLTVSNIDWSLPHEITGEINNGKLKLWLDGVELSPSGGWTANNPAGNTIVGLVRTSADAAHEIDSWVIYKL